MKGMLRAVVMPPMGLAYSALIDPEDSPGGAAAILPVDVGIEANAGRTIDLWCADNFLDRPDLPFCRAIRSRDGSVAPVFGPIIALAATVSDGRTRGLTRREASSILANGLLRTPQAIIPPDRPGLPYRILDSEAGFGGAPGNTTWELPERARAAMRLPGSPAGLDAFPVGAPEELVFGRWRIRIEYGDAVTEPFVSFYDIRSMSGERAVPRGSLVWRYPASGLEACERDGGGPWGIDGPAWSAAKSAAAAAARAHAREEEREEAGRGLDALECECSEGEARAGGSLGEIGRGEQR